MHFREPLLEFGGGSRHQDVRFGLTDFGPVDIDADRLRTVRIGIVGNAKTTDGFKNWLARCEKGIPAKNSRQPNLFPAFPGTNQDGPFRCHFEFSEHNTKVIPTATLNEITSESNDQLAIAKALDCFSAEIEALSQRDNPPNIIVCALPVEVIERVKN